MKFYYAIILLILIISTKSQPACKNCKEEINITGGYLETENTHIDISSGYMRTYDNGKKSTEIFIEGGYLETTEDKFISIRRGYLTIEENFTNILYGTLETMEIEVLNITRGSLNYKK